MKTDRMPKSMSCCVTSRPPRHRTMAVAIEPQNSTIGAKIEVSIALRRDS